MKRLALLAVMVAFAATASPAFGQATRTWVSGVGDDANPCSRTAPCKTFAGAISRTAVDGIIDAMDDGGFGAVTITKSITIDGGSHIAGLLASGGINGVNINIPATDPYRRVVLRNLSIEGMGTTLGLNGVNITGNGAQTVELENVRVAHFSRHGIFVTPNAAFPSQLNMLLNNVVVVDTGPGSAVSNAFEIRPATGLIR
jgi:pectate lyase